MMKNLDPNYQSILALIISGFKLMTVMIPHDSFYNYVYAEIFDTQFNLFDNISSFLCLSGNKRYFSNSASVYFWKYRIFRYIFLNLILSVKVVIILDLAQVWVLNTNLITKHFSNDIGLTDKGEKASGELLLI